MTTLHQSTSLSNQEAGAFSVALSSLHSAGIPIGKGFVVSASTFLVVAKENDFKDKLRKLSQNANVSSKHELDIMSKKIIKFIRNFEFPPQVEDAILQAYVSLGNPRVMLTGNVTESTAPYGLRIPYQFYGAKGESNLIEAIKDVWAHFFESALLLHQSDFFQEVPPIAVCVQTFPRLLNSGILYTVDPYEGKKQLCIKAVWGEGGVKDILSSADYYWVERDSGHILKTLGAKQQEEFVFEQGEMQKRHTPMTRQNKLKVENSLAEELAHIGKLANQKLFLPQQIHWIFDGKHVQVIDVESMDNQPPTHEVPKYAVQQSSSVEGIVVNPGIVSGPVCIVNSSHDQQGWEPRTIVITNSPEHVTNEMLKHSKAVIIEHGSLSPAQIHMVREYGVACLSSASGATHIFSSGTHITLNTNQGKAFAGTLHQSSAVPAVPPMTTPIQVGMEYLLRLSPRSIPGNIHKLLLRPDSMILSFGVHPLELQKQNKSQVFSHELVQAVSTLATHSDQLLYCFSHLTSQEYRHLSGGELYEGEPEANPLLGFHGAARYLLQPDILLPEITALKAIEQKQQMEALSLVIPGVRTAYEYREVSAILGHHKLGRRAGCRHLLLVDIPSIIWQLPDVIQMGVDGVIIDLDSLYLFSFAHEARTTQFAYQAKDVSSVLIHLLNNIASVCSESGVPCMLSGNTKLGDDMLDAAKRAGITTFFVPEQSYQHLYPYITRET